MHNWFGGGSSWLQMDQQDSDTHVLVLQSIYWHFLIGIKGLLAKSFTLQILHSFVVSWGKW